METPAEHLKGLQTDSIPETRSDFEIEQRTPAKKSLGKRIQGIVWDSLGKDPAERKLIAKLDWWILSYVCIAYFVKYLDQTNVNSPPNPYSKKILTVKGIECLCLWNERGPEPKRK
jgi:hypothetical protein